MSRGSGTVLGGRTCVQETQESWMGPPKGESYVSGDMCKERKVMESCW